MSSVVAVNDEGDAPGFSAMTVAPLSGWPLVVLDLPPMRPVWAAAGQRRHDQRGDKRHRRKERLRITHCLYLPGIERYNRLKYMLARSRQRLTPRTRPVRLMVVTVAGELGGTASSAICPARPRGRAGRACSRTRNRRRRFAGIDELVARPWPPRLTPGAVVRRRPRRQTSSIEKAFGFRATVPADEPMTLDTVFDLASLTKVVATTTAVMTLIEEGRVRLNDTVASHMPGIRALRQRRHHDPPSADARVGPAARCRSRHPWTGLRRGDRAGAGRSADRRRRASASSTATSTSSCSATSSRASPGSRSMRI